MTDGELDALRANLARHTDRARTRPLVELGQALTDRYWRAGPGSPSAAPYLDEAITVFAEAYGHLEEGEFLRAQTGGMLGWLYGARFTAHAGADSDREAGVGLLDEALAWPGLPPMQQAMFRIVLGQLLLSRVLRSMQSGEFATRLMRMGPTRAESADADRAVACLRQVIDGPRPSVELMTLAQTMLGMAEAIQTLMGGLGGGPGGLDLNRMMQALGGLQNLQQQAGGMSRGVGYGLRPNLFDLNADAFAAVDPLRRPVAVVEGTVPDSGRAALFESAAPAVPAPPREAPDPRPRVPSAGLRAELFDTLPGPGLSAVLDMLRDGGPPPAAETVDRMVALSSALVDTPDAVATDHLLLAAALHLRSRDGSGWGGEWDGEDVDDVRAAGESVIAAADPRAAADTVAVAVRLATLLDGRRPTLEVGARLGRRFAGVSEALCTVGADALVYATSGQLLALTAHAGKLSVVAAGSSLPERILVAGSGPVPAGPTVSYVSSAAQVMELAARTRLPITESAAFVANPRGDRRQATMDALILRRTFYPRSVGLGETVENVDGVGTPDEVRARLSASLLQLGCGVTVEGGLELAGSAVLDATDIAAGVASTTGGLAVLPATATGAGMLTEALLASRFVGVIGFRTSLPDEIASLVYFVLHAYLVDERRDPADAVKAVRTWLANPHRKAPEHLPSWCEPLLTSADLADPASCGDLALTGCGRERAVADGAR